MESNMFEKNFQIIPVLLLEEKTGIHYGSIKFCFKTSNFLIYHQLQYWICIQHFLK